MFNWLSKFFITANDNQILNKRLKHAIKGVEQQRRDLYKQYNRNVNAWKERKSLLFQMQEADHYRKLHTESLKKKEAELDIAIKEAEVARADYVLKAKKAQDIVSFYEAQSRNRNVI